MKKIKLNNNGFMLVEVIIVTVIVATIMTSLYMAFARVYKVYDMKSKYSNIDEIYALNTIKNYYIESITFNKLINNSKNTYKDLLEDINNGSNYCSTLISGGTSNNYCNKIKSIIENYQINNLYIVDKNKLTELENITSASQTLKDYINFLDNTLDKTDNSIKAYLVGEFTISNSDKIYNYAYLPIKS